MSVLSQINPVAAPALPFATDEYDRQYQDQFLSVLRLYFSRISSTVNLLTGEAGGQYVDCPNGLFFNTAEQTFAAINTAYPIVFNSTYLSSNVQLVSGSTSKIEVLVSGVYNFQYIGQILSENSSAKTMYIWINRNGTDIGYSTRANTLSSNNEFMEANWAFNIDLQVGDYIELKASVTDTGMHIHSEAASSPHPGIPSSVMTVNFIAPLPATLPTPP